MISAVLGVAVLAGMSSIGLRAVAQSPDVQEKLAAVKESSAQNKQALATYTWQEQDTISLKG